MTRTGGYKRLENNFVKKVKGGFSKTVRALDSFFKSAAEVMRRRYTIAFVPHSAKKVYNFQVTFASLCVIALVLSGMTASFVLYEASYGKYRRDISDRDVRLQDTQASLDQLRDEMSGLWREARNFQTALSSVFSSLGVNIAPDASEVDTSGDLSSFFDMRDAARVRLRETEDARNLAGYLSSAVEPLREMGTLLDSQSSLLSEIPNVWPIKGGAGHISTFFGETSDPFTGQLYVHKGIDLSTYRQGDPIVATADGQIVTVAYDAAGFGNYVIIRHKHGFYTRYGHMLSFAVRMGQHVQQGEVIGYIGNTGRSTGPHLHYEVHIGSDIVDPYKFLNVRNIRSGTVQVNLNGGKK